MIEGAGGVEVPKALFYAREQEAAMTEYKSFYKRAGGKEGSRCRYPVRLDTYGCGCSHDCGYCYAKSLLDFRGLWHP